MYKTCNSYKASRSNGDLSACLACRSCKGTGIVRDPDSYVCNGCGGGLCPRNDSCPYGLVEAVVDGGYSSTHLSDAVNYQFSLCEKCLREMFDRFVVPPTTWSETGDGCGYAEDSKQHRLRAWRESGARTAKLATGLCNVDPDCRKPAEWRTFYSGHMNDEAVCAAHRTIRVMNCRFVPAGPVADIPLEKSERTLEQKIRLADEYLKAVTRKDGSPMFFKYVDECVGDVVGEQRTVGAIWVPAGSAVPEYVLSLTAFNFPSGILWVGPTAEVLAKAAAHGVRPDPKIDELYPELCEDESAVGD